MKTLEEGEPDIPKEVVIVCGLISMYLMDADTYRSGSTLTWLEGNTPKAVLDWENRTIKLNPELPNLTKEMTRSLAGLQHYTCEP